MKNKFICILLLIIIVGSNILIYKINKSSAYNPETYNQVYKEYEQITNISNNFINALNNDLSISKHTTYISKTLSDRAPTTIAAINIPKINISYPVINDYSEENLNIAPVKYIGPEPNTIGNFVIVGHNNWNKTFFSNLHKLEKNDIVELTDIYGNKITYKVYDKYEVNQDDFSCLDQNTNGNIELTLITCIKYQKSKRLIVKCIAT